MKKQQDNPQLMNPLSEEEYKQELDNLAEIMSNVDMDDFKARIKEEIKKTAGKDKKLYDEMMQKFAVVESSTRFLREGGEVSETEWSFTHPFYLKCGSDKFYASLASQLLREFCCFEFDKSMPAGILRSSAMSLAAYLEDLVSGTGIWNAVRSICLEQNGGAFPFYEVDPDDYFDDDLNIQDVKLLIWQAFNRIGNAGAHVYSPMSPGVNYLSEIAYDTLINNFDKAPRATRVADKVRKVLRGDNYLDIRSLGYWLSIHSPITAAPYAFDNMLENAGVLFDELNERSEVDLTTCQYIMEARSGWTRWMSLNGCSSAHLLSVLAEEVGNRQLTDKLRNLKIYEQIIFTIEDKTKTHIIVKDPAGRTFNVRKDSFVSGINWSAKKSGFGNFVKFGDEYYQNGMAALYEQMPDNKKVGEIYGVTDDVIERTDEIVSKNRGRRFYYCKNLEEVSKYMPYNLPVMPNEDYNEEDDMNVLLILSSTDGPILRPGMCVLLKDKANRFYDSSLFRDKGLDQFYFVAHSYLPDDVIEYVVSHNLLPNARINASQGKRIGKAIVQDNMAFLMRFYRVQSFEKPSDYGQV